MREHIAGLCELLLLAIVRGLLPARGRHRAVGPTCPAAQGQPQPAGLTLDAHPFEPDTPLVRPYLLTPAERHERRLQRQRRRALWLAVHGVDVGPRHIHGMEVSA
ncbi:hypothetical protein [Streptomyces resistomycificus]|uniref:Uncharacterized protein n=1 Tax=Streptomyces resistomycificus TaxID=67356 RepID=A0A0L8L511_9ACTN|nr:hypothetical protein [Streptomyces resistomycificus]KOG33151.1 hypothetical protein ADK37_24100 [Streptomyces resistomycificus]KUN96374.1 hypothetical protein AQJ84_18440 [Streptomyces resistomycificus]